MHRHHEYSAQSLQSATRKGIWCRITQPELHLLINIIFCGADVSTYHRQAHMIWPQPSRRADQTIFYYCYGISSDFSLPRLPYTGYNSISFEPCSPAGEGFLCYYFLLSSFKSLSEVKFTIKDTSYQFLSSESNFPIAHQWKVRWHKTDQWSYVKWSTVFIKS